MAWIEVHQSLLTHRKTLRLCRLLKMDTFAVTGRLIALWCWGLDNAPNGEIAISDIDILSDVMGWDGEPSDLMDALMRAGFIDREDDDRFRIHDWNDYAGKLIEQRQANAARQKSWRDRKKETVLPSHNDDVTVTSPLRNGATVPNPTQQNHVNGNHSNNANRENAPIALATTRSLPRATAKTAKKTPPPPLPRERNPLWDALSHALGFEPKTRTECSNWGKVVKELNEAGATPEDVPKHVRNYVLRYGQERLTINALLTHWSETQTAGGNGNGHAKVSETSTRAIVDRDAEEREWQAQATAREAALVALLGGNETGS